jgi:hypothetical protein
MNTIGVFAGRGDVILAMGLAILVGAWAGWQARRLVSWMRRRSSGG